MGASTDPTAALSRRALLGGAAVALGATALARWRDPHIASGSSVTPRVDSVASAVEPARRKWLGNVDFIPPEPGEILFPVVVEADDRAYVLNNFGDRRGRTDGYYHKGVDIMADAGLPLRAVVDGEITRLHTVENDGFNGVRLVADDGTTYKYFHDTDDFNGAFVGAHVKQGAIIGFVGDSGTSAGNYHLHFEYLPDGVPTDPFGRLQRAPYVVFAD